MAWSNWEKVEGFDFKDIIYEKKYLDKGGGAARISFNRPHRMNAFTEVGMQEVGIALDDASHDDTIGVVVITGVGDHFGTGGDVTWEAGGGLRHSFYFSQPEHFYLRNCRNPVIAAVKGYCIGGSHHLAYFCDFTIASDDAIFGQNGPRVASPADGCVLAYLTRVVGAKKAREIWMLCRRYTAQEALQMGLANRVVPKERLEAEVDKWCEEILSLSPDCLEVAKASFDFDTQYMEASFGYHSRLMLPHWFEGPQVKEAGEAFEQRRPPDFWQFRPKPLRKS